jgi:gliding motility-associated-like protein
MKKLYQIILLLLVSQQLAAQNISGIINSYAQITAITQNVLNVSTTTGFAVGDKVLLIKMKGATINQTNTAAYGDTIALNEAGKYVFSNVIAVSPFPVNTITLSPFCDVFADDNYLQIVTVPIYPNPVISAPLTCQPWDGLTGGILIFETPNTLTFNADINTEFKGYRGGDVWGSTFSCGSTNYFSAQAFFGPEGKKGEGVADWIVGQECGKGKLANGGGGAYSGNTGAGGGGNAGKGGDGGFEYNGCGANPIIYSVGGLGINHVDTKLLMGAGGGGPQSDNGQQVYNGGNGGAIVFIKANNIAGNGFNIKTGGESPPQINDEGAPGGGAGGSVYFDVPNFAGNLNIEVKGGNGSSNFNILFANNCHGPGGGGGGGLVWFSTPVTPAGVTVNALGGNAGMVLNPGSPCFNTSYNAQPGNIGLVKHNFVPTPMVVPPTINIGNDTVLCPNSVLTLDAGAGFVTYLWDDNSTNQTRTVNSPGTFYVTVTTPNNCTASDTIVVSVDTSVKADFTATLHLGCENDTVFLVNNSQGATQYNWLFGDGGYSTFQNPVPYVYMTQGAYTIRLVVTNGGCADTMMVNVNTLHPLYSSFLLSNTTNPPNGIIDSICLGAIFNAISDPVEPAGANWIHEWNWGDGTPIINTPNSTHQYASPGAYTLTHVVTDTLGCKDSTIRYLYVDGIPVIDFTVSDSMICLGEKVSFFDYLTPNITTFNWDFADGSVLLNTHNPTHSWSDAGTYTVILNAFSTFCPPKTFSKPIIVNSFPNLSLGPDTMMCPGVTGSIFLSDINNPTASYVWSTGETGSGITVTQPGHYWVRASNGECSTVDSIWIKRDCYINVPNAFTPDGDGLNDYFLPREILSSGIKTFKMEIYNRWGENIFSTGSIEGRGWDGKYNGVPQLMGVYVYVIDVEFVNNIKKNFKGNVTLIR